MGTRRQAGQFYQHIYYIQRQGKGHLANAASLHLSASHSPGRLRNDGQVCTTALVGKVGLNLLAVRSLPWRELGAFAARDALPCEHGVLTAQQLQTCLAMFEEKPLLLQWDSSFCNETKVHNFPPPVSPVVSRNSNDTWSTNFPPCLSRLLFLKGWPVGL